MTAASPIRAERFAWLRVSGSQVVLLTSLIALLAGIGLFALFAWRDRVQTFREASGLAVNVASLMAEHAGRLLEMSDFILRQAVYGAGPGGAPIPASYEAWEALVKLKEATPYIVTIWVGNGEGRAVLVTRQHPPPPLSAAHGDYFRALREGAEEPVIGVIPSNRLDGGRWLLLARRLAALPGEFRGFATVTLKPEYFQEFYRSIDIGYETVIELIGSDGALLAHEPPVAPDLLAAARKPPEFAAALATRPSGVFPALSPIDGVLRINAFRRIPGYDAVVNVMIANDDIHARWLARVWTYSYYGFAGLLALLVLAYFALQRARHEQAAQRALRSVNDLLEERVAERTADLEQANLRLQAALADKEVLFKEVHHRVKNNLQVISSLLRLQAAELDEPARAGFQESLSRIQSMGLVHELLYRSDEPARIDFAAYLRSLGESLAQSYGLEARGIRIGVRADSIRLDLDTVMPLALLVSELVSNALKHAFPGDRAGRIDVSAERAPAGLRLVVQDDGVGLAEDPDANDDSSLGMQIVRALACQLGAELQVQTGAGTCFTVTVPRSEPGPTASTA